MSSANEFERIHRELPIWIAEATISKCSVDRRNSIVSKFLKYVVEPQVKMNKVKLEKGEKVTIDVNPLIEAAMRGWKELPIRPLSKKEMEFAVSSVGGLRIIEGLHVKLSYTKHNDKKSIVIQVEKPPPPPPPPPQQAYGVEIWGIGNVILGLELLRGDKLGNNIKTVDLTIETESECGFHITKASLSDLEWTIGEDPINTFIRRISPKTPEVKFAKLLIKLLIPTSKDELEKMIGDCGISEDSYNVLMKG